MRACSVVPVAIAALGALATLGVAGVRLVTARPAGDWHAALLHAIETVEQRQREHRTTRPPAWGETVPGSAFAAYAGASELLHRQGTLQWDPRARRPGTWTPRGVVPAGAEELRACRAAWEPGFAALHAGAHRADASPSFQTHVRPLDCAHRANVEVHLRLGEQRGLDAVRLWLDAATLLVDCDFCHSLAVSLWDDDALAALEPAARTELRAGLAVLDARLAIPRDPALPLAHAARELLDGRVTVWEWSWRQVLAAWQQDFRHPIEQHLHGIAERLAQLERHAPRAASGRARDAEWQALRAMPCRVPSPVADHALNVAHGDDRARLRTLARLRLLRLALALHGGELLPPLVDPWSGEPFDVRRDGGAFVLTASELGARGAHHARPR